MNAYKFVVMVSEFKVSAMTTTLQTMMDVTVSANFNKDSSVIPQSIQLTAAAHKNFFMTSAQSPKQMTKKHQPSSFWNHLTNYYLFKCYRKTFILMDQISVSLTWSLSWSNNRTKSSVICSSNWSKLRTMRFGCRLSTTSQWKDSKPKYCSTTQKRGTWTQLRS